MVEAFVGKPEGDINDWKITKTPYTFREVVFPGEMQPDQWPKYRYLMLELWRPKQERLRSVVDKERNLARSQVFDALTNRFKQEYTQRESKREDALAESEYERFRASAAQALRVLLGNLGWRSDEIPSKTRLESLANEEPKQVPPVPAAEAEEVWESVEEI